MPVDYLSEVPELARKVHSRWAVVDGMQALVYDAELAHLVLDEVGVPRVLEPGTQELSLVNRVTFLHAQLVSAREVLAAGRSSVVQRGVELGEDGSERTVVYKRTYRTKVVAR